VKTGNFSLKLWCLIGAVLTVTGFVVPASTLVDLLRTTPESLRQHLILGATLFKIGLVLNGLFIIAAASIIGSSWRSQDAEKVNGTHQTLPSVILASILLTALIMRFYNLGQGIWFDEIVTYVLYMERPLGEILTTYDNQNNHLLYTLLARICFLIFGESVWSLRFPAVLFGVGSIWAMYLFSCQVATWREGLLSAGLLTFSYHHVWFSQNARGYTALLFWSLLSSWLLLRALNESRAGLWLMYGLSTAFGILTHMTMFFVVAGHGIVYLVSLYQSAGSNRRIKWLGGLVGFGVAALVTFQLYSFVLPQLLNWNGNGVSSWQGNVAVLPWKSPVWMIGELLKAGNISAGSSLPIIVAAAAFGIGLTDFVRKGSPVAILLLVPVVLAMAVIMAVKSTLLPRLFFFGTGFAVMVAIRGLMVGGGYLSGTLGLKPGRAQWIGVGLCIVTILGSGISVARAYQPKQDFAGALDFVQTQRQPGDVVLTVDLTVLPYQRFYKVDWEKVASQRELDKARVRGKRTWLVYTMPIVLQAAHPEIMESINSDFQTIKEFRGTLSGGNIVVALAKS
jgi:hypothetical protein